MLRAFGYAVEERDGWIRFEPTGRIEPFELEVPGDPSSAAFLVGAAVLAEAGELRVPGVGVNPTRTGLLRVLERMGATVEVEGVADRFGEPVADLVVAARARFGRRRSTRARSPGLIDEIPLLAVLASRAERQTVFREVGELRVKESDRLSLIADNLGSVGGRAAVGGMTSTSRAIEGPPRGRVRSAGDHRIAMAFAVLGTVPGARIAIDDLAARR